MKPLFLPATLLFATAIMAQGSAPSAPPPQGPYDPLAGMDANGRIERLADIKQQVGEDSALLTGDE